MQTAVQNIKKQRIFFALGTVNTLTYFDSADEQAVNEAVHRVRQLHDMLSAFDVNSEISKINFSAGKAPVRVSPETLKLVTDSVIYSRLTGGTFDITTRCLSKLWKSAISTGIEPLDSEIENALLLTGWRDILIDKKRKTVMLRREGMKMDLGAIAKGYAADEVRKIFVRHRIENAIINLGGTVITMGENTIGLQDPFRKTGASFASIRLADKAVVSSGTYEQCLKKDGTLLHHIIDPKTGYPAATELVSVTLTGDSAEELDALSTSVLMLGIKKGMALLKERGIEGIFVTNDGRVYATEGLKDILTI